MPLVFWTFLAGAASLAALLPVTAGFYSRNGSYRRSGPSGGGGAWLWAAASRERSSRPYTLRVVFVVFFGPERARISRGPGLK